MPQAISTPTSPALGFPVMHAQLDITFEELAIATRLHNGEKFFAGFLDGRAVIEYDNSTEWQISDIVLQSDNRKIGAAGKSRELRLDADRDEPLMLLIMDALTEQYTAQIEERIEQAMAEDRDYTPRVFRAA